MSTSRVQLKHPDPAKSAPRISAQKYEAVKLAILRAVAQNENGILFKDLPGRVSELLSPGQLENLGSVGWYTTTVKLDLEARGLIERLPGSSPQRLRLLE
ncbi:MAG: hypothetical protein P8X95_16175 [Anaerolineales bacterium]|jgi:hypothetical protein